MACLPHSARMKWFEQRQCQAKVSFCLLIYRIASHFSPRQDSQSFDAFRRLHITFHGWNIKESCVWMNLLLVIATIDAANVYDSLKTRDSYRRCWAQPLCFLHARRVDWRCWTAQSSLRRKWDVTLNGPISYIHEYMYRCNACIARKNRGRSQGM